ncbi:hypothetical protein ACNTMW_33565 [Planosporangium sp. 12N6]|uniref:hypothetical protein n=1 Tax=Planosporangium spinosum TaxID=3402278 RepID=UPI003CEE0268
MRGMIAALTLSGAALLTVGCADDGAGTPVRGAGPPASAAPASPDPQATAVCADLRGTVLDTDAKAFGAELGRLVAARSQGDRAGESQAQQAATATLTRIADRLRTHATGATDPRLTGALDTSAANLDRLGADPATFAGLTSLETVSQTTARFTAALGEVTDYCSA